MNYEEYICLLLFIADFARLYREMRIFLLQQQLTQTLPECQQSFWSINKTMFSPNADSIQASGVSVF